MWYCVPGRWRVWRRLEDQDGVAATGQNEWLKDRHQTRKIYVRKIALETNINPDDMDRRERRMRMKTNKEAG